MGCVCGRPAAIDDGRCGQTPPPARKLSAAGVAVLRREEEARKQARARDEALERRRAAAMAMAACQVRSPVPRALEAEQVAAGWPPWLASVAAEAVRGWVPRRAESFEKLDKIGQGTYSNVYRARDLEKQKIVALKKVRFDNLEPESVKFMAREILILRRLDHPNIIKLEGLVTSRMSCSLYLVFEYMEHDLAGLASFPGLKLTEPQVKCYMQQLLRGLEHCHSRHILHRDIKGSNLLIDNRGILKIADFGLASFFDPEQRHPLTSRVVTLWYRPPELLLGATNYGVAVDLWSTGCILAELYAGKPIMPGRTEVEQLHKIFKLCGSPSEDYWRKSKLPHATIFKPQHPYARRVTDTFKDFPSPALALVDVLLSVDPADRRTASSALQSEFFTTKPYACNPSSLPRYPPSKEYDAKRRDEEGRRQGTAGGKQHPERRTRESKAVPAPDANAELVSSLQRQAQANTKSRSEMFNPCKEDSASGFPIEPPSSTHIIELSGDSKHVYPTRTFHSGPLVNPSKTGTSKHGEHHARAIADPRNFPVVVSAKSDTRPDDSNVTGFTQAEAFAHGRRLSESINGHFSGSGKYDQVFQQKDEKSAGRVDGGAIGYGSTSEMEACASTSRVLLPFPPRAARPAPACSRRRRRGVRLAPARASLEHAAVLLDAAAAVGAVEGAGAGTGYSQASYYTSLGLFVLSVPGLWSLIKRSVKSKIVQKTFIREEGQPTAPSLVAGEILSFFTRNSFAVSDRGEVITFEGTMTPSSSQAALLTFCTVISLGSVGLVLSIAVPEGGNNWFWLMTLSPLAGVYYWTKASRKEEIKVKMVLSDDGNSVSEILVRGDDLQVEQMRRELKMSEKGMIYVKGIFET